MIWNLLSNESLNGDGGEKVQIPFQADSELEPLFTMADFPKETKSLIDN